MIPILDARRLSGDFDGFAADLGQACRSIGFAVIQNPDVPPSLLGQVFAQAQALFALPQTAKDAIAITTNPHNRGYTALGVENLDDTSDLTDRKEAFNIGLDLAPDDPRVLAQEPYRGVNLWPDLPGFQQTMLDYYTAALGFGVTLHQAIAADLGLDHGFFANHLDASLSTLRLLRYPAASGAAQEIGAGAHTDYGTITLLATDGTPGLQVKPRDGDWTDVPFVENAYIMNIGDLLMRWTNDTYVSTPHRVLPPPRTRLSIAFFIDPNPDSLVEALPGTGAPKYPAISGADYLTQRLNATYESRRS